MEGRPPPDLEPQDQQEEEEVSVVFHADFHNHTA